MALPYEVSRVEHLCDPTGGGLSQHFLTGETIPIRLFLGGFDLTPTFRDVNKKFSVRYYLNLVLIDEENRRYFKQQVCTRVIVARAYVHGAHILLARKSRFSGYQK